MKKTWKILIGIVLAALLLGTYALGNNKGYTDGWNEGQMNLKENMIIEILQFGVTHIDYEINRLYLAPIPEETARELINENK